MDKLYSRTGNQTRIHESKSDNQTSLKSHTRRGYGRKTRKWNHLRNHNLSAIGTNSDGLNTKRESLFYLVNKLWPSIITIQETKFTHYGTLKIPGYEVFENLRVDKKDVGLLTAILSDLNPAIIDSDIDVELLIVQINIGNLKIRVFNGYGPQEDDNINKMNNVSCLK